MIIEMFYTKQFYSIIDDTKLMDFHQLIRELEIEEGLSNRKTEAELMAAKPKVSESEKQVATDWDCSEDAKSKQERKFNANNETTTLIEQPLDTCDKIKPSALPPPEMFEIRNSSPLPFAGNKKLKKLIEKNKK